MSTQSIHQSHSLNVKYYIHSFIVLVLMFGFPLLPTIQPLTELGMQVVGIFLGCLYGWTFVSIIWPSMLGLLALGFTEFGTMQETFAAAFGGDTYLFVFFMLAFAALISQAGVTDFIAKWVISRKIAAGRPYVIAGLVYAAAFVVGALVSVMPSIVICWTLTYQLCTEFGYSNKDLYPKLMIIGVVNAALMGHCVFPFKPFAVMMRNVLVTQVGYDIDFGRFTFFAAVLGIGSILIWMALCKFAYKPDVAPIAKSQFIFTNDEHLTTYQKQVLGLLGLLILAMFLPGFLPDCALKTFLATLGNTGLVLAALMICAFVQMKDGKTFADVADLIRAGVPWPTMFLLATAMTLASAIGGETGVAALFKQLLGPVFIGHGVFLFTILMIIITIILTNIINNVVVGLIMVPIICTFSAELGFSPAILTTAICLICNITFLLPSGSPIAAFLHGNSEWLTTLEIQKYSILLVVLDALWICLVCMSLGNLLW